MGERIIVGLSGGVDSSVAAAVLVEQGFDVVGVTLRVWPWRAGESESARFGSCCSPSTVEDARQVARQLGIPYYLLNSEQEFDRVVIEEFSRQYQAGRTPVPCVACNRDVKFGSLLRRARAWGATAVATGHYARITRDGNAGRWLLWRGRDSRKDQSDFLWPLTQAQLEAARFPVGDLTKEEVRARARSLGLATAEKPESQEICFVPDNDYRRFLRERTPGAFSAGKIVDSAGAVIGEHRGLPNFTIGQRRGLGVQSGRPLYVTALDPERNVVVVGGAQDLESDRLWAEDVNWIVAPPTEALVVSAKIRHSHQPAAATIRSVETPRGSRVEVRFEMAQRSITPGQSVVFYQGDLVVGGGVISPAPREGP